MRKGPPQYFENVKYILGAYASIIKLYTKVSFVHYDEFDSGKMVQRVMTQDTTIFID